ncbi:MAG: hypothetical protein ABW039_05235 [Sphingobium sp.]
MTLFSGLKALLFPVSTATAGAPAGQPGSIPGADFAAMLDTAEAIAMVTPVAAGALAADPANSLAVDDAVTPQTPTGTAPVDVAPPQSAGVAPSHLPVASPPQASPVRNAADAIPEVPGVRAVPTLSPSDIIDVAAGQADAPEPAPSPHMPGPHQAEDADAVADERVIAPVPADPATVPQPNMPDRPSSDTPRSERHDQVRGPRAPRPMLTSPIAAAALVPHTAAPVADSVTPPTAAVATESDTVVMPAAPPSSPVTTAMPVPAIAVEAPVQRPGRGDDAPVLAAPAATAAPSDEVTDAPEAAQDNPAPIAADPVILPGLSPLLIPAAPMPVAPPVPVPGIVADEATPAAHVARPVSSPVVPAPRSSDAASPIAEPSSALPRPAPIPRDPVAPDRPLVWAASSAADGAETMERGEPEPGPAMLAPVSVASQALTGDRPAEHSQSIPTGGIPVAAEAADDAMPTAAPVRPDILVTAPVAPSADGTGSVHVPTPVEAAPKPVAPSAGGTASVHVPTPVDVAPIPATPDRVAAPVAAPSDTLSATHIIAPAIPPVRTAVPDVSAPATVAAPPADAAAAVIDHALPAPPAIATGTAPVAGPALGVTPTVAVSPLTSETIDAPAAAQPAQAGFVVPAEPMDQADKAPMKSEVMTLLQIVRDYAAGRGPAPEQPSARIAAGASATPPRRADRHTPANDVAMVDGARAAAQVTALGQGAVASPAAARPADVAAAITGQIVQSGTSGQWIESLAQDIARFAAGGEQSRFRVVAGQLGPVDVAILPQAAGMAISLTVGSEAAETALQQDSDQLRKESAFAGLRIGEIRVERAPHVAEAARSDGDTQQKGGSSGQGQGQSQGTSAQTQAGMGQSSGQNRGQGQENAATGHKVSADPAVIRRREALDASFVGARASAAGERYA